MRKICGISLFALLIGASCAVYADIPSTGYVDKKIANKLDKNTAITAGTATKITYDTKGLVTAGGGLSASDIPSLTAAKIADFNTAADAAIATSIASGAIKTELDKKQNILKAGTGGNISASNGVNVTASGNGNVAISGVTAAATTPGVVTLNKVTDVANEAIENALDLGEGAIGVLIDSVYTEVLDLEETALDNVTSTGTGTVVKAIAKDGKNVSATLGTITNSDVASDAAIAMSKIAMPNTSTGVSADGVYVLTMKVVNGVPTYYWENIARNSQ